MLKKGSWNSNVKDEVRKEERRHKSLKNRKKIWQKKSNKTECSKHLDK